MKTLEALEKVLKGKRLRPTTVRNYRAAFTSLAAVSEEWPKSSAIINEWLVSFTGIADSTVVSRYALVHAGAKYLERVYGMPNPCVGSERPKMAKKRRRYFTPEDMVAIVEACLNEYELLLVLTLIDSACRVGELVGLTGKDVGDGFIDVVGKTGQRRYRLDPRLCQRLRVFAGGDDEPVFKHRDGGFFCDGCALSLRARRIAVRAGLKGELLGPHTIRHSSASLLAQKTGQALAVKALLQHDDVQMSMRYIHDVDEMAIRDDKNSPLRILGERCAEFAQDGGRMSEFGLSCKVVDGSSSIPVISSCSNEFFPVIPDGLDVEVVLRDIDLSLIREVFIFYARHNSNSVVDCARQLFGRLVREGDMEFSEGDILSPESEVGEGDGASRKVIKEVCCERV